VQPLPTAAVAFTLHLESYHCEARRAAAVPLGRAKAEMLKAKVKTVAGGQWSAVRGRQSVDGRREAIVAAGGRFGIWELGVGI
jgi:hypothetical protein